jgi:hypothetical protein
MKTLNYTWISNLEEWTNAVNNGFTMMISQPGDSRGKYIACGDDYKEVFEYLNDESFDDDEHIAFPIELGEENFA